MYGFKCGSDGKNKLKGFCEFESKNINFEEINNCLFGEHYEINVKIL